MYELGEKEEWIELYKYKNNFLKEILLGFKLIRKKRKVRIL